MALLWRDREHLASHALWISRNPCLAVGFTGQRREGGRGRLHAAQPRQERPLGARSQREAQRGPRARALRGRLRCGGRGQPRAFQSQPESELQVSGSRREKEAGILLRVSRRVRRDRLVPGVGKGCGRTLRARRGLGGPGGTPRSRAEHSGARPSCLREGSVLLGCRGTLTPGGRGGAGTGRTWPGAASPRLAGVRTGAPGDPQPPRRRGAAARPAERVGGAGARRPLAPGAPRAPARSARRARRASLLPALFIFQRAEPGRPSVRRASVRPSVRAEPARRSLHGRPAGPAPCAAPPPARAGLRAARRASGRGARASGLGGARGRARARGAGLRAGPAAGRGRRRGGSALGAPGSAPGALRSAAAPPPLLDVSSARGEEGFFPFCSVRIEGAEGRGVPAHI